MESFFLELGKKNYFHPLFEKELWNNATVIDFSHNDFWEKEYVSSDGKGANIKVWEHIKKAKALMGIGGREKRPSPYSFKEHFSTGAEIRDIHIGLDFYVLAGTKIFSPMNGLIHFAKDFGKGDYGNAIILKHEIKNKIFYSLFGHLSRKSLERIKTGNSIQKGELIGFVGETFENGGWQPHLHFQIIVEKEKEMQKELLENNSPWGYVSMHHLKNNEFNVFERFPDPALLWPNTKWFNALEKRNQWKKN